MGNISTGLCTDRCSQQQEPTSCYSTDSQRLHHCCSCKQGWKYQPEASLSMPTAQVLHPTQETSLDQAMIKQSVHKVISISSVLQANKLQTSSSHTQWWQKETLITDKNFQVYRICYHTMLAPTDQQKLLAFCLFSYSLFLTDKLFPLVSNTFFIRKAIQNNINNITCYTACCWLKTDVLLHPMFCQHSTLMKNDKNLQHRCYWASILLIISTSLKVFQHFLLAQLHRCCRFLSFFH